MKLSIQKYFFSYFVLTMFVSLIVGFRGNTRDTRVYYEIFKNISSYDLLNPTNFYQITGMEILFGWYSQFIRTFSSSPVLMFWGWSFSIFIFLYLISKRISKNHIWVLLLYISSGYFAIWQFMQIRQGLAVVLALYAVTIFILEKRYFLFLLFSLLGLATHQVAGIILLCGLLGTLFIHWNKMTLNQFKLFSCLLLVFIIVTNKFIFIDILFSLSDRIISYSEILSDTKGGLRLPDIKALLTFIALLLLTNNKLYRNKIYQIFFLLFVIGVACRIGFIDLPILSGRFASSLTFSEIYLLPMVFFRFKKFGIYFLLFFIIIQAISTYGFQVPEEFYQSYFYPYED